MNETAKTRRGARKEMLFEQIARMGHALGTPARLRMMARLVHRPHTVEDLAVETGQTIAATSAHLKSLREAGLVESIREGRHIRCRIASAEAANLWLALRDTAVKTMPLAREIHAEITTVAEPAPRSPGELRSRMKEARGRLIDLRPESEYAENHIPGAISLPGGEAADTRLPPSGTDAAPYLAYCRGPHCDLALRGVERIVATGRPAVALPFSVPEWVAAGYRPER